MVRGKHINLPDFTKLDTAPARLDPVTRPWKPTLEAAAKGELQVRDDVSYRDAVELLQGIKQARAEIAADKEVLYRPVKTALDSISNKYHTIDKPLKKAEEHIRKECSDWVANNYREALGAAKEGAQKALDNGNPALARAVLDLVDTRSCAPMVEGVSLRQQLTFEMVDAEKLPREFLMPDEDKIKALVKSIGSDAEEKLNGAIRITRRVQMIVRK